MRLVAEYMASCEMRACKPKYKLDSQPGNTNGFSKSILIREPETLGLLVLGLGGLVVAWRGSCFGSLSEAAGTATLTFAESGIRKESAGLRMDGRGLVRSVDRLGRVVCLCGESR